MKKCKLYKFILLCSSLMLTAHILMGCIPSLIINDNYFADKVDYMSYEIEYDEDNVPKLKTESGSLTLGILQDDNEANVPMLTYYSITLTPMETFDGIDVYAVILYFRAEADCMLSISLWLSPTDFFAKDVYLKAQTSSSVQWDITDWNEKYDGSPILFTLNNPFDIGEIKWSFDNIMFCANAPV